MPSSGQITETNNAAVLENNGLPDSYGATEAILLPRDHDWMFVYWEITGRTRAGICGEYGQDIFQKSGHVIRVYEVSGDESANSGGQEHVDVPIIAEAKNWYINVRKSGKTYRCEVGLTLPDGRFVGLARSNTVKLPEAAPRDVSDEKWISVTSDFDKLLQLSGMGYAGKGLDDVAKSFSQRWEMLRKVFSQASSWGVSSLSSRSPEKSVQKDLWLLADCELIVYGATQPDAGLTVSGRKVKLNPDGTFSMRFAFPDTSMTLPIRAVSSDGTRADTIEIKVSRATATRGKTSQTAA